MPRHAHTDGLIACCAIDLSGQAPEWIQLLPAGRIEARDGRRWTMDDAQAVLASSRAHAGDTEQVIDYEHQSEYAEQNGQMAPAAGWIRELAVRAGAIWGRIDWTARAKEMIAAREYRYISPVFYHDETGRVTLVDGATLTNKPALDLRALARRQRGTDDMNETLIKLLNLLGFTTPKEEDLTPALAKVQALVDAEAAAAQDTKALAAAVGLAEGAQPKAILAKAKALAERPPADDVDPEKYVPMEQFKAVAKDLKTLQDERAADKADAAVDAAVKAGKIAPAQRDWALAYAKSNATGFDAFVAAAPVIVAPGERNPGGPPADDVTLTAEEKAVCKASDISEEAFLATKKSELEARAS